MRPSIDHIAAAHSAYRKTRAVPQWLAAAQDDAWQKVTDHGLPNRKDEHWKYTSLFDLAKIPFTTPLAQTPALLDTKSVYTDKECYLIELVNGRMTETQQVLAKGLTITSNHNNLPCLNKPRPARPSVIQDLNLAFADHVLVVKLDKGTVLDKPIYLKSISSGDHTISAPHIHFNIGPNCELTVVEHLSGNGQDSLSARCLTFDLGSNSTVNHNTLQVAGSETSLLANVDANLADHSAYNSLYIDLGARLGRHDLGITLNGNGAECRMLGCFIPSTKQHLDHHTLVKHNVANTQSAQVYHGIAGHRGHGVFNGKVYVAQDAQKINADQSNKNILLSENTNIDTKPELEIYADDVKCSHGATIGQLDDNALLYLRSRGIGLRQAQLVLVRGFANEIYQHLRCEKFRTFVADSVESKLDLMLEELS